jgi:signal transduction histidine kinase
MGAGLTPPSIQSRLQGSLLLMAVGWSLAVALAVWLAVRHEADELLDDTLRASADVMAGALADAGGTALHGPGRPRFAWQVVDAGGRVVAKSPRVPDSPLVPGRAAGVHDTAQWRVLGTPLAGSPNLLYVAQTQAERREARREIATYAATVALAVSLLAVLGLRLVARRELAPLHALSAAVARFDPLRPAATVGPPQRAELAGVHVAIDELGRRLAQRVGAERAFASHAAHALRTPLAGIDAQLAVALRECPPEVQWRLQRVRDAAGRLQRVVTALLTLFRSGLEPVRERFDLAALLVRLPVQGLAVDVAPGQTVDADADLLAAVLLNLLDNSLRYGARRVGVSLQREGDVQVLRLHDDGPGVHAAQREALRAALADAASTSGTGLGLRLAELVARAHGGQLELPDVERGFAVTVRLPCALPAAPAGAR